MDTLYGTKEYFEISRAANVSFKAFFDIIRGDDALSGIGNFLFENYSGAALSFALVCVFLISSRHVRDLEALTLCAIASARLIPIAGGYTLMTFSIVALFYSALTASSPDSIVNRLLLIGAAVSMLPVQFGLSFAPFRADEYTFASVVGPAISLMLFGLILGCWCYRFVVLSGYRRDGAQPEVTGC